MHASAYALAFKKVFEKCNRFNKEFELGCILQGIIIDWLDAEISGLKTAIGNDLVGKLLKGCKVHWQRSCQCVADKVATSSDKEKETYTYEDLITDPNTRELSEHCGLTMWCSFRLTASENLASG